MCDISSKKIAFWSANIQRYYTLQQLVLKTGCTAVVSVRRKTQNKWWKTNYFHDLFVQLSHKKLFMKLIFSTVLVFAFCLVLQTLFCTFHNFITHSFFLRHKCCWWTQNLSFPQVVGFFVTSSFLWTMAFFSVSDFPTRSRIRLAASFNRDEAQR